MFLQKLKERREEREGLRHLYGAQDQDLVLRVQQSG
jgi:hypothetical protein